MGDERRTNHPPQRAARADVDAIGDPAVATWPAPTPIPVTPRTRTILLIAAAVVVVGLVWAAPIVPRLLLAGAALALVLSFPVDLLCRLMPRRLAIFLVVVGVLLLLLVALLVLIPITIVQLTELIAASSSYATGAEEMLVEGLEWLQARGWLAEEPESVLAQFRQRILEQSESLLEQLLVGLLEAVSGTLGALIGVFGVLFVAVYMLADVERFKTAYLRLTPPRYRDDAETLWRMLNQSLTRYIGGLLISIAVQGSAATLALWMLDVPYAFLLGLWTAATAILPYIGAYLGAIPAVIIALFVSPLTALLTVLVFLAINQIEGNLLTPRIQGEAVRVHPMLVFLAVIAGSAIGGLLGAVLAVPMLAVVRVLVEFFGARLVVVQRPLRLAGPRPADRPDRKQGERG